MISSTRGLTTAILALSCALSISVVGPHRAYAAPGASATQADAAMAITVLSPTPHTSFGGSKPIEVSAFYQGSDTNQISAIELYIDGSSAFTKRLDAPEGRGVISFLIDVTQLAAGPHKVVVRAIATDAEVVSAKTSFVFVTEPAAAAVPSVAAPSVPAAAPSAESLLPALSYLTPTADDKVSGTVRIQLKASEPDGKAPYVSLFIDRSFKTLRNYSPYVYDWDTTGYTNGYHTIEAYGYDEAQNVGPAEVMRIYVNNPGGHTGIRTDLKDATPAKRNAPKPAVGSASVIAPVDNSSKAAVHSAVPTRPGDAPSLANSLPTGPKRPISLKPLQMAKLDAAANQAGSDITLSDPFITTSGARVGSKTLGAARRPSPLLATAAYSQTSGVLRTVMMAKRLDLLDETGGLHSGTDLTDPYIPATTTPIPATHATQTPTSGFKPLPTAKHTVGGDPSLAMTERVKSSSPLAAPDLITRNAHIVPGQVPAPLIEMPNINIKQTAMTTTTVPAHQKAIAVQTPATVVKTIAVHTPAVPTAKPVVVQTAAVPTAAKPAKVMIHITAPAARKVAVHTGAPTNSSLMQAKGQLKVIFNHTTLRLDRPIADKSGVMFSPLRQIFEFEGGSLTWQSKTGQVRATTDTKDIRLKVGDRNASVNDVSTLLDMAPYLDQGRTMVPLTFLPTALDVDVRFDKASGHLLVTTKK